MIVASRKPTRSYQPGEYKKNTFGLNKDARAGRPHKIIGKGEGDKFEFLDTQLAPAQRTRTSRTCDNLASSRCPSTHSPPQMMLAPNKYLPIPRKAAVLYPLALRKSNLSVLCATWALVVQDAIVPHQTIVRETVFKYSALRLWFRAGYPLVTMGILEYN